MDKKFIPSVPPSYFKDSDFSAMSGAVVLLDVGGTLLAEGGSRDPDQETLAAAKALASRNTVYLCTNRNDSDSLRKLAGLIGGDVKYHESRFRKPSRACVADILPSDGRQVVVIGDTFFYDALLAYAIDAPFIRVMTLKSENSKFGFFEKIQENLEQLIWRMFGKFIRGPGTDDSLTILSEIPLSFSQLPTYFFGRLKMSLKRGLFMMTRDNRFRTVGGPEGVLDSLTRGLDAIGASYRLNPWQHEITGTVSVVSGADTLRWAIDQKKKGFIRKIVAGPNIVVAPTDENNLMKDPLIDRVVIPSEWNKKWWMIFDQLFESKAVVWAAGVSDNGAERDANGVCLVYSKNADEKLFQKVIEVLWTYKLPIVVSHYGTFRQDEYFRLLKGAKMLVYLSPSESQGLALNEAWMADIPTLAWSRGYFMYQEKRFEDPMVGAPYLSSECGLRFISDEDFERKLIEFLDKYNSFKPREYSLAHFTNAICARKYLAIVESINSK